MDTKKIILATLAGGATLFALGFLIYVLAFGDATFYKAEGAAAIEKNPIEFWAIILMELLYGLLLTLVFSRWAGIKTFAGGLKAGAWIGFLIGTCIGLEIFATANWILLSGVVFNALTFAVRFAIAGGVVGLVLGSGDNKG